MHIRLTRRRLIMGALTFLLITISGLSPFFTVKNVSAKSECLIIILCPLIPIPIPTPTPSPTPMPTSTPGSGSAPEPIATSGATSGSTPTSELTPGSTITSGSPSGSTTTSGSTSGSTPTSGQTSGPRPKPSPVTRGTGVLPTATSTGIAHTPVPSPTNTSPLTGWNDKILPLGQFGSSEFLHMMMIAVVIFLCLLFSLGIGLFIFRRKLLPSIYVKGLSSGTSSWSLAAVPWAFVKGISTKRKKG